MVMIMRIDIVGNDDVDDQDYDDDDDYDSYYDDDIYDEGVMGGTSDGSGSN